LTRRIARCQARFQKLGIAKFIAHDLRRTCRTYLSRLGIDQFIAERVLNHVREGIEGVYDLYEFLPQKRRALEQWATYLDTIRAEAAAERVETLRRAPPVRPGRALTEEQLRLFTLHYQKAARTRSLARLLKLLLFTAAEPRELCTARWRDMDLEGHTWMIPENESVNREAFLVPLTKTAIAEFRALKAMSDGTDYVMPLRGRNAPVRTHYLTRRLARCQSRFERLGVARFLPPDLQTTCIDTLVRLGVPQSDVSPLVERMPKGIDGNYDLYEHLTEKRSTLERWESHLVSISNPSATTKEDHPPHMPAGRATMQIAGQQSLAEGGSGSSHTVDIQKTYTIP
jgi:integrase